MKDIVIIANFCDVGSESTNNRFNYIAEALTKYPDYSVELITSSFSHRDKSQRDPNELVKMPYKTTLISEPGYAKNVSLKRFYSHWKAGKNLIRYLAEREVPDVIYCAVPSLDFAKAAAKYARNENVKFIVDIQDLWPEAFKLVFNIPLLKDVLFTPMQAVANFIYRSADCLVAVSDTYLQRGLSVNPSPAVKKTVYLGTDLIEFDRCALAFAPQKPKGEIWITYVGTLGHSYNINIVIEALALLKSKNHPVRFKVLGDGPQMSAFMHYAAERGVQVDFLGRLPYEKMVGILKASDIAVNPIAKCAAQSIINKHADYAAAGIPVVNTQENLEYRSLLEEYCCGINCAATDAAQVADALEQLICSLNLRQMMGENSRKCAVERFDRRCTYKELVNIISND